MSDKFQFREILFDREKDIPGFWPECNQIEDKVAIYESIKRAVPDVTPRTLTKLSDVESNILQSITNCENESEDLTRHLSNYFEENKPSSQDDFNTWHSAVCDIILSKLKGLYNGVHYGKAQKILNMTLKNLYCTPFGQARKEYFDFCHMPLDSFTLEWAYRNVYSYLRSLDEPQKEKLTKERTPSWSNLHSESESNDVEEKYYTYQFLTERIIQYFGAYNKHFGQNLTVLQAEFVIWKDIQLELSLENLYSQLLSSSPSPLSKKEKDKETREFKACAKKDKIETVRNCLSSLIE